MARLLARCSLVAVLTGLAHTAAATIPPAEKLLPADTLLVISIPDCARARENYQKSPRGRLLDDPAMKPIRDKFMAKFRNEFLEPLERELGSKVDDYGALAQGQFTFAITMEGWNGQNDKQPALLLLLDTRDKSAQLKTNLATLRKKWIESGKPAKTEKIRSTEFMVLPISSNDVPKTIREFFPQHQEVQELGKESKTKGNTPSELYIGQFESLLLVGDSAGGLEKVIAHLTGSSIPALADEPLFEADRLAMFREASVFSWINVKRFMDVLMSMPPEEPNPQAPSLMPQFDMRKILSATGLSAVRTVAFASRQTDSGAMAEFFIGVPDSTRQGLFKILAAPGKESGPPAFVPAEAAKFQRIRVDGSQAMATMEKMFSEIYPPFANLYNFFLSSASLRQKEKNPDFDLKKDLIGNLGDDFIYWAKPPRRDSGAIEAPSIFLIGSPNPDKMATALQILLSAAPGTELKEREFLGRKIYSVNRTASALGRTRNTSQPLSFSPAGGYVALSSDTALLEEYLRSNDGQLKPLRQLPGLAEAAQKVGGQGTGIFTYENEAEMMRVAFQALRQAAAETNQPPSFNPITSSMPFANPEKSFKGWVDFSLLPDFDRVSKYFHFTVFASSATVNGISFRAYSPTPPALR